MTRSGDGFQRHPEVTIPVSTSRPSPFPNLIVVGVAKAGTSSLFRYLVQHPEICGSSVKELHYYNQFGRESVLADGRRGLSRREYLEHFSHCTTERYLLEATPAYFYGGEDLIRSIQEETSSARLIVSLRDPVARVWSFYNFERGRFGIPREMPFSEYVERCVRAWKASPDGLIEDNAYRAISGGFYVNHLSCWLDAFGSQFQVVFFEDLVADPLGVMVRLCNWLEVDDSPMVNADYSAVNTTQMYRLGALERLSRVGQRVARRGLGSSPATLQRLRRLYNAINRTSVDSPGRRDSHVWEGLRAVFRDSNTELAATLRQAGYCGLPAWLDE